MEDNGTAIQPRVVGPVALWRSWLARFPVTEEVAGSSPVRVARSGKERGSYPQVPLVQHGEGGKDDAASDSNTSITLDLTKRETWCKMMPSKHFAT